MSKQTPNQIVARNLQRARELRKMSQRQAGEALAPYLGQAWSRARWSQAERTAPVDKVRGFTADELQAFSQVFDLPVMWFLLPDPEDVPESVGSDPTGEYLARLWPLLTEKAPELSISLAALADVAGWDVPKRMRAAASPIVLHALVAMAPDLLEVKRIGSKLMASLEELQDFVAKTERDTADALFAVTEGDEDE